MFSKFLNIKSFLPLLMLFLLVSCDQDEFVQDDFDYDGLVSDIENLTNRGYTADLAELDLDMENDLEMQRFRGKRKCFTFVFPVTLIYPNGDQLVIENKEDFRAAMKEWKENNPDSEERPVLEFPFEVMMRDSTLVTVENQEALDAVKEECFENRPSFPRFKLCFNPVFPLDIAFPDGSVETVEDHESLKVLMQAWKENNPDAEERPEIVFPIEIELPNGDIVEVANIDELKERLKDCVEKIKKQNKNKNKNKGDK